MGEVNRDLRFDFVKGISILGVIYVHFAPLACANDLFVRAVIYISRLSVPFFVVIYCFFLEIKIKGSGDNVCAQRQKQLFASYILWSIIYFCISADFYHLYHNPQKIITGFWWGYGWPGQYFFLILFQINIVFPFVRRVFLNRGFEILVLLVSCIIYLYISYYEVSSIVEKLGSAPVIYWLPYVGLGVILANMYVNGKVVNMRICIYRIPLGIIIIGFVLAERFSYPVYSHFPYFFVMVLLATYIILPLVLLCPGRTMQRFGWVDEIIHKLGKNSMAIFVMNPLLLYLLSPYAQNLNACGTHYVFLMSILIVLGVAGFFLIVTPFLKRTLISFFI